MLVLKILGFVFITIPILAFTAFSIWMLKGIMGDDEVVKGFVSTMLILLLAGIGILAFVYISEFTGSIP